MEMPLNFWDDFLTTCYDIFAILWEGGHSLWVWFTMPLKESYLILNDGVIDEFTESILNSFGQFTPIQMMLGGAILIIVVRFVFKIFVPFL